MSNLTLKDDGDSLEIYYWDKFIKDKFPSYEKFWKEHIVELTNRPIDIHFKTNKELADIGKSEADVCVAQLHYSILRHLSRVFEILQKNSLDLNDLTEGMTRICGSLDVAFELLERFSSPQQYDPWLDKKKNGIMGGKEARENWQKNNNYPLQELRNYRNHLIHGRMLPGIINQIQYFPKIGLERKYFDWRLITDPNNNPGLNGSDLASARDILLIVWYEALAYLENSWHNKLLS
jgi:hypothetical protein